MAKVIEKINKKFFKYLTIGAATLGLVSTTTFAVTMAIHATDDSFIVDELREYTATFKNEGSVIISKTYKRGEEIETPENPSHSVDGENNYFFIGWDLTGNGIPDLVPQRIYFDFNAEAVYLKTGKFDLSFLDLTNMDLETLLQLMENLNIDWEQFMEMFNIDPETLAAWLAEQRILTFTTDKDSYATYFRATSLGNYSFNTKQYANPEYYNHELISANSVNPLSYTANLLEDVSGLARDKLDETFSFINYDITFESKQNYYPVPDCEYSHSGNQVVDSDAHYLKEPESNKYETRAALCPAFNQVIQALKGFSFLRSSARVRSDEKTYRNYAKEHYTTVPDEYNDLINDIIKQHGWQPGDITQVDNIAAYVSTCAECSLFKDGSVDISGMNKNKNDPIRGLLDSGSGSDFDFSTLAIMIFRKLGIPARMVKGYLAPYIKANEENYITLLNQHYWSEIYVDDVGWMFCECTNLSGISDDFTPYKDADINNQRISRELDHIEITRDPNKTVYQPGADIITAGIKVMAYFKTGDPEDVTKSPNTKYPLKAPMEPGDYDMKVSYTSRDKTETDTFKITVEKPKAVKSIVFNYDDVKKDYFVGDPFNPSGLTALVTYEDDTTTTLYYPNDIKIDNISEINMNETGSYTVDVSVKHNDFTEVGSYEIHVYKKNVKRIIIDYLPNKLVYYEEEEDQDLTGLSISYELEDGTIVPGTLSDVTIDFGDMYYAEDNHIVTISYYNEYTGTQITETFTITINTNLVTDIHINGARQSYLVSEPFSMYEFLKNATASVSYEHTKDQTINVGELYSVNDPDLSHEGTTYCRVGYKDKKNRVTTTDVPITVNSTGGPIDLELSLDSRFDTTYDPYEITYTGENNIIFANWTVKDRSSVPEFLNITVEAESIGATPDNGTDVAEHTYQPVLRLTNKYTYEDVTNKYSFYINSGGEAISYYVNPRDISITVKPKKKTNGEAYKPNEPVELEYVVTEGSFGYADSLYFEGTITFPYIGNYSNYQDYGLESVTIKKYGSYGTDVTLCYNLSITYETVVIKE